MNDIYDNSWPKKFLQQMDRILERDRIMLSDPLYMEYTEKLYEIMTERLKLAFFHDFSKDDVLDINLSKALNYIIESGDDNKALDFLTSLAESECSAMKIWYGLYDVIYIFFALEFIKGNERGAKCLFNFLMRPVVISYRFRSIARKRGSKGGRPPHRLHEEALILAEHYFSSNPGAPISRAVQYVSGKFVVKYSDVPSASTIRKWISKRY
ncbi:hypothetical protein E6W93_22360 [Salmonella enterica subsp. enterica serovar Uppsala]|nr:hypothetical protein [Salmonella enterica subsp. enterica serovar Uppsala]